MLKRLVRSYIRRFGFDVHRLSPNSDSVFQLLKCLDWVAVDLVVDIGANTGQFAAGLRSAGYRGEIVSFEPLTAAYHALSSSCHDKRWRIHPRTAIGDFDGEIEINVAGNSVSSSVLPMLDTHAKAEVKSAYIGSERVPITRLDSVMPAYLHGESRFFLKIDVQGFEWQVLDGAVETLRQARGVLCELSLVPLYEGQRLWRDIIERLEAEGFTLWAIQRGFTDPRDGRSLQFDAIFLRVEVP